MRTENSAFRRLRMRTSFLIRIAKLLDLLYHAFGNFAMIFGKLSKYVENCPHLFDFPDQRYSISVSIYSLF